MLPDRWLADHPEQRLEQREEESREAKGRRRPKRAAASVLPAGLAYADKDHWRARVDELSIRQSGCGRSPTGPSSTPVNDPTGNWSGMWGWAGTRTGVPHVLRTTHLRWV
jgi:hypothetical protein